MTVDDKEGGSLARFEALLDAYGAEPRRWPEDRRAWAEALLARSPAAVSARDEAARLDLLLDAADTEGASAALMGRVLAAAPAPRRPLRLRLREILKPAIGLAFAAVLGLALGSVVSPFATGAPGDMVDNDSVSLDIASISEIQP
jgi:hypothetical protein